MAKFVYLYQTSNNENRSGTVRAANRAEAYATLRRQGIRPYRVIGDDPVRWQPWAIAAAVVLLLGAAIWFGRRLAGGDGNYAAGVRAQLAGDREELSRGLESGWTNVFSSALDRHLAAYAQPGWIAIPPESSPDADFLGALDQPPAVCDGDSDLVRQLKRIVGGMHAEMRRYLDAGGTLDDYFAFLEQRQDEEIDLRLRALDTLERTPAPLREKVRLNLNVRLAAQGLAELP